MKHLYRCVLYLILVSLLSIFALTLWVNVETLALIAVKLLGFWDKVDLIAPVFAKIPNWSIQVGLVFCVLLVALALYKEKFVLASVRLFLGYWLEVFINLFSSLRTWEIAAVMLIPFASSLYFAHVIAVSYDEAITYNYFTAKPFFYCMIFYPYPNNHVLHSLLTNLTEYTPFVGVLFSIRIPAILSSLLTWLVGYSFLKKYYSSRVALVVVGIASVFYMSIYYSFMSRGYAFTVLAFVVCMYAAFNIIQKGSRNKDWMFFVMAGVLGCYAIPSFLYPFATLNLLILIYNYKNIKQQIVANVVAGLAVVLLYLPIMLVDGVAALTSNQFVQHVERSFILKGFLYFYQAMFADIAGVPFWLIFVSVIPFGFTIWQKDKWHLSLWGVFALAPFVLLILHAVNPFYRTFLYYNFVVLFLMIVPFRTYLEKIPLYVVVLFVCFIQVLGVYNFNSKIRDEEGFNTKAAIISDEYFNEENTISFPCIASENYVFAARVKGLDDNIHFLNQEKANADTINDYDYVIIEEGRDLTMNKKVYKNFNNQNIYKNEK